VPPAGQRRLSRRCKERVLTVSKRTLRILAAIVWYAGSISLLVKAGSLILEARMLRPDSDWPQLAMIAGLFAGGLKAWLLFSKVCAQNLARIAALRTPQVWEFYRLRFYFFLILMIAGGAALSRLAHDNFPFLMGVAILDLSIGTALLGSSYVFWKRKLFVS
jgi:hypothetical protein